MLHVPEQLERAPPVPDGVERHDELAGLRAGHPRVRVDAPDAEARHHEVVPAGRDHAVGVLAADGAAEHRVVPVHRERRLVQEGIAVVTDGVPQPTGRELPRRLRVAHQVRQRQTGPQRLVAAGRARQQRLLAHAGGRAVDPVLHPGEASEGQLHPDDEVERGAHHRPGVLHEGPVAPDEPVVPDAHRDVRRHVRLAAVVDHLRADDLDGPRAVGALLRTTPGVGPLGRLDLAPHQQRHRRLDVVPGVRLVAGGPRDRSVRVLHRGDRRRRAPHVVGAQHAGDRGDGRHRAADAPGGAHSGLRK
ncbi:hypothetical protein [Nocardioides zeae]